MAYQGLGDLDIQGFFDTHPSASDMTRDEALATLRLVGATDSGSSREVIVISYGPANYLLRVRGGSCSATRVADIIERIAKQVGGRP